MKSAHVVSLDLSRLSKGERSTCAFAGICVYAPYCEGCWWNAVRQSSRSFLAAPSSGRNAR